MIPTDRLGDEVRRTSNSGRRMLVVFATLGDPLTEDLLAHVVTAGADGLELGLPTSRTRPGGTEIRRSFERAVQHARRDVWYQLHEIRERLPDTVLLPLVYPETVLDLGLDRILGESKSTEMDGLVLVQPSARGLLDRVAQSGLSAVPVIKPALDARVEARLEAAAPHLTYRVLATRTGAPLGLAGARAAAAILRARARRACLVGFGIRTESEIRVLAPEVTGFVIGSEFLRVLRNAKPGRRHDVLARRIQAWKAAADASPNSSPPSSSSGRPD
jgi:tryptophan synthase alpha chain